MSWPLVKLGDVVDIKGGGTPNKDNPEYWGGDIPWASVKDFKSNSLRETADYVTKLGVEKSATNVIPSGNVIIPTRMALGKVAINEVDMAINQDLKALLVKDEKRLSKIYLMRFLESKADFLDEQGKGATVKGITLDVLRGMEIPLPPLAEQKRIAAILDKADAIRRKRQQAIQLADDFLRAVFLDMFGDPVTNPKGWDSCKFEDLTSLVTYGLTVRPQYHEEGIPLISAREIRTGELDFESCPKISRSDFDMLSDKGRPKKDDILFSKTGSIGHCAIVRADLDFAVTQNAARIVPNKEVCDPIFLLAFMRTNYFYDLANKEAKGNAVKDLQLGIMKDFPMYIPPVSLQKKFVDVYSKASVLSEKVSGGSILLNSNFGALSQRAFSGQL
ncbi:restriction endonuclease subunit S [Stutzerimonas kunmingensis]|uniref:restriction endonuclease subunit S n=1 Tax=Stutzerimonas kunmingensis TaxID=1211807 RepID=UPI0028A5E9F8|nr:restriction endonuclease subunit S [Stutzerimonas kunmingensis]